jgi:hypothetical protein
MSKDFHLINDYDCLDIIAWATKLYGDPINLKSNLAALYHDLNGKWSIVTVEMNDLPYSFFWTQDPDICTNFILTWHNKTG